MDKIHVCTIASMFPYISITDVHASIIDVDVSISVSIIDIDVSITDVHVLIIDVDVSIHLRRSGERMRAHDMTHPSLAHHTPQSLARACAVYTRYAVSRASPSYEVGNIDTSDSDSKRISQEPTSTSIEEIES